jgi:hypothetical protein
MHPGPSHNFLIEELPFSNGFREGLIRVLTAFSRAEQPAVV